MLRGISLALLVFLLCTGFLAAEDPAPPLQPPGASKPRQTNTRENRRRWPLLSRLPERQVTGSADTLQDALARQAREIQALKQQYARELEQQKKRAELQQKQIEILQKTAQLLADQIKKQAAAPASTQAIDKLQEKTDLLESRAQQAARRDRELAGATDNLREKLDSEIRNGPRLPAAAEGALSLQLHQRNTAEHLRPDALQLRQAERSERQFHHDAGFTLFSASAQQTVLSGSKHRY